MEDDQRQFEPVNIGMTSVETGKERFTKNEICILPPISYWRNNLTGLSQRYNLYFIATGADIVVYKPDFPFQKLKSTPQLLIPPTLANPGAQGYINPANSHAINHLLIGNLGNEEILLVATDSGNVAGYHTKSISEAIKKDPYRFSTNARSDHVGVRTFFSQWVHESAWGLAIHSDARMIAVSANTPHRLRVDDPSAKITVFAFALLSEDKEVGSASENFDFELDSQCSEWHDWDCRGSKSGGPTRNRNFKITLGGLDGHKTNIPCVSFVNTPDDKEGQWLLSTEIGGEMKIWQIWQGACYKSWNFADRSRSALPWLRETQGGWLVAALDSFAFRPAFSMAEFCGHSKATQYYGYRGAGNSYNISNIVRLRTPGNSLSYPNFNESSGDEEDLQENENYDEPIEPWSDAEDLAVAEDNPSTHADRLNLAQNTMTTYSHTDTLPGDILENDAPRNDVITQPSPVSNVLRLTERIISPENLAYTTNTGNPRIGLLPEHVVSLESDSEYFSDEDRYQLEMNTMEDISDSDLSDDIPSDSDRSSTSVSSLTQRNSTDMQEEFVSSTSNDTNSSTAGPVIDSMRSKGELQRGLRPLRTDLQKVTHRFSHIPSFPAIHCSASHLRLLKAPDADSPHLFCANILKQNLPTALEASQHAGFGRLNMIQQIPELGVVLIATQIGRCAVCSLTKSAEDGSLGLRVDWTLPTKRQERAGIRPMGPLLGIAAGPIQGQMKGCDDEVSRSSSEEEWGQDGVSDGVATSFSSEVVVLNNSGTTPHEDDLTSYYDNNDERVDENWYRIRKQRQPGGHAAKRTRLSSSSQGSTTSGVRVEKRPWTTPQPMESWRAVGSSRRYRLMMTYSDMTVLTYEISKYVEKDDIC